VSVLQSPSIACLGCPTQKEGDMPFRDGMSQRETDDFAVEPDRAVEIADSDVGFPQATDGHESHDLLRSSSIQTTMTVVVRLILSMGV
jgi:hypothetical protein